MVTVQSNLQNALHFVGVAYPPNKISKTVLKIQAFYTCFWNFAWLWTVTYWLNNKKEITNCNLLKHRSDKIRTCDLYVPNVALYQTEPHSDKIGNLPKQIPSYGKGTWTPTNRVRVCCAANYTIPHYLSFVCCLFQTTWLLYQSYRKMQPLFWYFCVRLFREIVLNVRKLRKFISPNEKGHRR